ncbi:hypothetical protein [Winogradskyella poriferorum]|uniref:hypothetical protein n=1 Tax=Winogradskyella poriferorum TaxID=307627 RepID=UPI003D652778
MQRDREVNQELRDLDFTVFRFWVHEIKENLKTCINDVMMYLDLAKGNTTI